MIVNYFKMHRIVRQQIMKQTFNQTKSASSLPHPSQTQSTEQRTPNRITANPNENDGSQSQKVLNTSENSQQIETRSPTFQGKSCQNFGHFSSQFRYDQDRRNLALQYQQQISYMSNFYPPNNYYRQQRGGRGGFLQSMIGRGRGQRIENYLQPIQMGMQPQQQPHSPLLQSGHGIVDTPANQTHQNKSSMKQINKEVQTSNEGASRDISGQYPYYGVQYSMEMHEAEQMNNDFRYNRFYPDYTNGYYAADHFDYSNHYFHTQMQHQHQYSRQHTGHQIHHRSRGRGQLFPPSSTRGGFRGGANMSHHQREIAYQSHEPELYWDEQYMDFYDPQFEPEPMYFDHFYQYPQPRQFQQKETQNTPYMTHKRQFANNIYDRDDEIYFNEESKQEPQYTLHAQLTKASRVLRRGRGRRNDNPVPLEGGSQIENKIGNQPSEYQIQSPQQQWNSKRKQEESKQTQKLFHQNDESQMQQQKNQFKIVPRQGGRGQRGNFNAHPNTQRVKSGMPHQFHSESMLSQGVQEVFDNQYHAENKIGQRGRGRKMGFVSDRERIDVKQFTQEENNFEAAFESEHSNDFIPEYERYDEFEDEETFAPKPIKPVHYTQMTFDDSNTHSSVEDDQSRDREHHKRRGPKIIKFKQKKPQERQAISQQLKNDVGHDKTDLLDIYTPKNTQDKTQLKILRPYNNLNMPEFYQGPQWKFVRQSTNQNSKQKHYETGDYDKVQYNFPGAENEDKETEDGELKLYPPIDDFSDEDLGAGSQNNIRAKISFGLSPDGSQKKLPQNIQNLINQSNSDQSGKMLKKKKPVENKTFTGEHQIKDEALIKRKGNQTELNIESIPISMQGAHDFFLKQESDSTSTQDECEYFDAHVTDENEIATNLELGKYFKGYFRTNQKNRTRRGWVSIKDVNVTFHITDMKNMNRAFDGDEVIVELLPPHMWPAISEQFLNQAKITATDLKTGQKLEGINAIRGITSDNKAYTNEKAVEIRTVDIDKLRKQSNQLSPSQSEDEKKIPNIQNKKRNPRSAIFEEEIEGYNASNSDNNFEFQKNKVKIKANELTLSKNATSKLSRSSSENNFKSDKQVHQTQEPPNMWQHLEKVLMKNDSDTSDNGSSNEFQFTMNIVEDDNSLEKKFDELSRHERIHLIQEIMKERRPLAKVVSIVSSPAREQQQLCTIVEVESMLKVKGEISKSYYYVSPCNVSMPWLQLKEPPEQYIQDKFNNKNPSHRYYLFSYKDWKTTYKRAICKIVDCIGEGGNLRAETQRILKQNKIFTESYEVNGEECVHECLKVFTKNIDSETQEWIIPKKEIKQRLDLRNKRIFSIDPVTAKDLDDALSIEKVSESIYEIGVHIADVSFFVSQGSDLDYQARQRGSSTYMVHKVFPMLPRLLSEKLCSLNPNVDRLTYSVFFRINLKTGKLVQDFNPLITRSVIKSCAKWNYPLVEDIIDNKVTSQDQLPISLKPQGHTFLDCANDVIMMNKIAQIRRKDRLENGSLEIRNPEFEFMLNEETKYPIAYNEYRQMKSKHLVEEFMLLANIIVAEHLSKYCKDKTLLRIHRAINDETKQEMVDYFQKLKIPFDMTNNLSIRKSMTNLQSYSDYEDKLIVINRKFLTSIKMAEYVCIDDLNTDEHHHFGLNFAYYTHFTSPIRRYADLLVHRLLTISLKEGDKTRESMEGIDYSDFAVEITEKSYNAKRASRDCEFLFHCLLLKDYGEKVYEAIIFDVESSKVSLLIKELNYHKHYSLRDDKRFSETTLVNGENTVAVAFRVPLKLDRTIRKCDGIQSLMFTNKLKTQLKQNIADPNVEESLNEANKDETLDNHCAFKVFDRVKVLLSLSDSFPMDIKIKLLITEEDLQNYDSRRAEQFEKNEAIKQMIKLQGSAVERSTVDV